MRETIARSMRDPAFSAPKLITDVSSAGGKLPAAIIGQGRGSWLVWQMLVNSKSPETTDSILAGLAVRHALRETPGRLANALIGRNQVRPESGLPLTNEEAAGILRVEAGSCLRTIAESIRGGKKTD